MIITINDDYGRFFDDREGGFRRDDILQHHRLPVAHRRSAGVDPWRSKSIYSSYNI